MTSPDPTRLIAAANAVGHDKPQLALTLANSGLSTSEMHTVGGFSNALGLAAANRLALDSGAATNFTASEQNHLAAIGEQPTNQPEPAKPDSRSWLEKAADAVGGALSNTGNFLLTNPVTQGIEAGLNAVGNAAHLPFRMLSSAIDQGNDAEVDAQMRAKGLDPSSAGDYINFMFNDGESLYHSLDGLRNQFDAKGTVDWQGNQLSYVDLAVQQQSDPEGFQKSLEAMDPNAAAAVVKTLNSDDYKNVFDQVDQQHISPGRDIARLITFGHTNNEAFTVLSGTLDAAYDWFADPTLVLGKVSAGVRAADALGRVAENASLGQRAINAIAQAPALRNARAGIQSITDQAGVDALLATDHTGQAVTRVGKGWQQFLDMASQYRQAHAAAGAASTVEEATQHAATRAAVYANMQKRFGSLMPILDEINGFKVPPLAAKFVSGGEIERSALTDAAHAANGGVPGAETATLDGITNTAAGGFEVTKSAPIEKLDDLAKYLVSRDGLLRLNNGMAAQEKLVMPGRLSAWAEKRMAVADALHLDAGSKVTKWIDYSAAHRLLPDETEQGALDAMDAASLTDPVARAKAGDDYFNMLKKGTPDGSGTRLNPLQLIQSARARTERVNRRLTTMLPMFDHIDLTAAESAKTVNQFARLYMNKGDAALATSAYSMGNLAERRQLVKGILQQSFHASGLSRSAAGRKMMDDYMGDQAVLSRQKYGMDDTSVLKTDSGEREVALYPDQLNTKVFIPSFKDMNYLAAKYAVGGFASRTGIASIRSTAQAGWMDQVMGRIKLGWITSAAGGLRNSVDEIAGFLTKGMGADLVKARVLFTQQTKDLRANRRELSDEFLGMVKSEGGRANAREQLGYMVGSATKSHEEAKLAMERAIKSGDADAIEEAGQHVADAAAELAHTRGLENAIQYRIPLQFRKLADHTNDVLIGSVLGKLLSVRGGKYALTEDDYKYAAELTNIELTRTLRDGVFQSHYADDASLVASDAGAMDLHRSGLQARKYAYQSKFAGWGQVEADGGAGLDSWAKYLQLRFADPTSPAHVWAQTMLHTNGDLRAAKDAIRQYMDEPVMRHFVDNAEVTNTLKDGTKATTPEMRSQALDEYADRVSADLLTGLSRRPGERMPDGVISDAQKIASAQAHHDATLQRLNGLPDRHIRARDKAERQHAWAVRQLDKVSKGTDETAIAHATTHLANKQEALDALTTGHAKIMAGAEADFEKAKARLDSALNPGSVVRAESGEIAGIHQDLLYHLAHSNELGVPDRSWLANSVPTEARPSHTIGQLWAPYNSKHDIGQMPAGYTPMLSQAYGKVVTDQINALSRNPLMTHLYVTARKNTEPYEQKLLEAGFTPEAAASVTQKIALSHAETEAFKSIDNPYVASQFSTISRNLWAFERAQEDWLRRWGRTIRDNPQVIRQAQLLIHGGTSTGLVDKDDQGNLQFVYPGSGLAVSVFNKAFKAMGLGDQVQIPMVGELTSQLMFLNPSLDNPIGFSGTPLLSLPLKVISSTLGAHHPVLMAGLDKAVNGQLGAGKQWYEMILPSWANRIMGGVLSEDPASKFGAAYTQALFNADAAGQLDQYRDGDASAKARFQNSLSTQVHNNLLATALFGFFAPAAPALDYTVDPATGDPVEGDAESGYRGNKADWSAHLEGLNSLKDEYRQMAARMGPEKANAWWAAVHPNELIYEQGGAGARTKAGTTSASAPATIRAATWMEQNPDFLKEYGGKGGIGTYFMPQGTVGTPDGQYSDVAYRAQLEDGMRQYKSLDDVFDDIVIARGEQIYYDAKSGYDTQIAQARSMGDNTQVSSLQDEWEAKKKEIYAGNPLLEKKNMSFATSTADQGMALTKLYQLVQDPSPAVAKAVGANRDGVAALLAAYEQFQASTQALSGRRGPYAAGLRADVKDSYAAATANVAQQFPDLADLIRGVFRTPN